MQLTSVVNAGTDTDKFLVLDSDGNVDFRTGANVLSDIGGQASGTYVTDSGGAACQVAVWSSGTAISGSNDLFFNTANNRLGIGTATPDSNLHVAGEINATGGDGYRIDSKPWACFGSNLLTLGDFDGEGYETRIMDSDSNEALRVTSGKKVGIGTTTPSVPLEIAGSDNTLLYLSSSTANVYLRLDDNTSTNGNFIGATGNEMHFWTNNTRAATIDGSQCVGIGTTSPGKKLHVAGEISGSAIHAIGGSSANKFYSTNTGTIAEFKPSDTRSGMQPIFLYRSSVQGSANYILANGGSTFFGTYDSGVPSDASGMIKIVPNNSSEAPNVSIGDAGSNGAYLDIGGNIKLLNNGSSYINGGNVGIGTTTPDEKLTVAGNISGSGCIQIGTGHTNSGTLASIAGGTAHIISSGHCSFIGGGNLNFINNEESAIVGGKQNCVCAQQSFIGAGNQHTICSRRSIIVGGRRNCITDSTAECSVLVGGSNQILEYGLNATIVGGDCNVVSGSCSFLGGGAFNKVDSDVSVVVGGTLNTGSGACGFIGGGCLNNICSNETFAVIGGGRQNRVDGDYGVIAGGYLNCTDENCSFIGGGCSNHIQDGHSSVIAGGQNNCISGSHSGHGFQTIAGGCNNKAMEIFATVMGGGANCACGYFSVIGGGEANLVTFNSSDYFSGIFSGCTNTLTGNRSFIGGGSLNIINGPNDGVIAGGRMNCITGNCSFIGAGTLNTGSTEYGFIGGGYSNFIDNTQNDADFIGAGFRNCIAGETGCTAIVSGSVVIQLVGLHFLVL